MDADRKSMIAHWLKKHEGFRAHPYRDTQGKLTIGYGRNLDDVGITPQEAEVMLHNDIDKCYEKLSSFIFFNEQPGIVQNALLNMCFNMGIGKLLMFKKMLEALDKRDYTTAAKEALNSLWAKQVGDRAKDVALKIRMGDAQEK